MATRIRNLSDRLLRLFCTNIDHVHAGTARREAKSDGTTDAAGAARYDDRFPIEPEAIRILDGVLQRETPRFQGMKSFCANNSAFVCVSPLATCTTRSRINSPI